MSTMDKIFLSLKYSFVLLAPLWLYLAVRLVFQPEGFWQNLVLAGVGLYFLGSIQFTLLIILLVLLYLTWKVPTPGKPFYLRPEKRR